MTYPNAAAGLKTMYQAKLVGLISIVPVFLPIIQVFAAAALLVAGILTLIGLYQCRKDDSGCRTAFTLVIVQLVTNLLSRFIPGIIGTIFLLATDVLGLASLYFVCTTIRLLKPVGAEERITDRGVVVWKINVICTVIMMVCQLIQMIPSVILGTPCSCGIPTARWYFMFLLRCTRIKWCNIEYKLYEWYILCHEKSLPFTGGS